MTDHAGGPETSEFGRDLDEFARQWSARIDDEADSRVNHSRPFKEEIFIELMAEQLGESRQFGDPEFGWYAGMVGAARMRIHGAAFGDEGRHLFLLTALYDGSPRATGISRADAQVLAQQALRFLRRAKEGIRFGALSDDAWSLVRALSGAWPVVTHVTVIVATDKVFDGKPIAMDPLEGRSVDCDVFDLRSLFRLTAQTLADIDIDLAERVGMPIPCLARAQDDDEYDCYFTILPGALLATLYGEYDVRLLEFNVRAFLGSTNKVNAGIRRTLREQPNRFLAYNNGISATVKSIEWEEEGSTIKAVRGLQIVNGGQTVAALHHASKNEKLSLANVSVAAKITKVKSADESIFVGQVSACANTQSIVQIADFSANRLFHIELERLSNRIWVPGERRRWFFERTRGQYHVAKSKEGNSTAAKKRFRDRCPPQRKFSKTDLAKFVNAWDRKPYSVCNGAQYNYKSWLEEADATEWMPDEVWYRSLIAKAIIFKAAQRAVLAAELPGYRAQIAAYLVARVSEEYWEDIDIESVWLAQKLSSEFESLLALWTPAVDKAIRETAERRDVTQWCKQAACWSAVQSVPMPRPAAAPREVTRLIARNTEDGSA